MIPSTASLWVGKEVGLAEFWRPESTESDHLAESDEDTFEQFLSQPGGFGVALEAAVHRMQDAIASLRSG